MKSLKHLIVLTLLGTSAAFAVVPNHDDPTTFVGPTLRGSYTGWMNNWSAYSLLGELGLKNYRVNGTLGFMMAPNQRIKVGAEFLWQKITFGFFSGNADEWVNQGAIGLDYQYDFGCAFSPTFDLSLYGSHAASRSLSDVSGAYIDSLGTTIFFTDVRRIAGSNAYGIAPGIDFTLWQGGRAGVALNYDHVDYKTTGSDTDAKGVGFTAKLHQMINEGMSLDLSGAWRKPFHNYTAGINWENLYYNGRWRMGLFAAYNDGRNELTDVWNAGVRLDYFADSMVMTHNYKGEMMGAATDAQFLSWVNDPAVYMPRVLAIVDSCSNAVGLIGIIPDTSVGSGTTTIDLAGYFTGQNLTYSVSVTPAFESTDSITINPNTGVLTIFSSGQTTVDYNVVVTARNGCGSATANTFVVSMSD